MGSYVPNTRGEQEQMLAEAGYGSFEELFSCIPEELRLARELDLPAGMGEMAVAARMEEMAEKNRVFRHIFRGAGAYHHYIPAIVGSVTGKEEFLTAYTPYQAEISQGILQSIFEYQTMICELTGMDVSNASVYDGGTAAAEAMAMCRERNRSAVYVSSAVHPGVRSVMDTYAFGSDTAIAGIPERNGRTDIGALEELLAGDETAAMVYIQQPNFYGLYEDVEKIAEITHAAGARLVVGVNPIALGLIRSPRSCGADIAVGDAQPLGLPLSYGGPYIGFMATTEKLTRRLPGRIVGETTDSRGERAFVLTLQAREQHIRREKADSNICSNQALCALTVGVYLSAMGPDGLREVAAQCTAKAHYLRDRLAEAGLAPCHDGEFFHEFVTSGPDAKGLSDALKERGILGGLPLDETRILWCATERNTREEIDAVAEIVAEFCRGGRMS